MFGFLNPRSPVREGVPRGATPPDYDDVQQHLAANLARLRARKGWTQQQAADAAGLDLKHIQKLEYCELNPTLRTLVRLANGLGIPIGRLLAPTTAKPPKRPVGRPRSRPKRKSPGKPRA